MAIIYRTGRRIPRRERSRQAAFELRRKLADALTEATTFGRTHMIERRLVPVNTGTGRASIQTRVDRTRLVGRIFTTQRSMIVQELGRTPGRRPPPTNAIQLWARRKRIQPNEGRSVTSLRSLAFVIARKIAVKGTKALRFFARTAVVISQRLPSIIRRHVGR